MWKKNRDGTPRKFLVLVAAVLTLTTTLMLFYSENVNAAPSGYALELWDNSTTINYAAWANFTLNGTVTVELDFKVNAATDANGDGVIYVTLALCNGTTTISGLRFSAANALQAYNGAWNSVGTWNTTWQHYKLVFDKTSGAVYLYNNATLLANYTVTDTNFANFKINYAGAYDTCDIEVDNLLIYNETTTAYNETFDTQTTTLAFSDPTTAGYAAIATSTNTTADVVPSPAPPVTGPAISSAYIAEYNNTTNTVRLNIDLSNRTLIRKPFSETAGWISAGAGSILIVNDTMYITGRLRTGDTYRGHYLYIYERPLNSTTYTEVLNISTADLGIDSFERSSLEYINGEFYFYYCIDPTNSTLWETYVVHSKNISDLKTLILNGNVTRLAFEGGNVKDPVVWEYNGSYYIEVERNATVSLTYGAENEVVLYKSSDPLFTNYTRVINFMDVWDAAQGVAIRSGHTGTIVYDNKSGYFISILEGVIQNGTVYDHFWWFAVSKNIDTGWTYAGKKYWETTADNRFDYRYFDYYTTDTGYYAILSIDDSNTGVYNYYLLGGAVSATSNTTTNNTTADNTTGNAGSGFFENINTDSLWDYIVKYWIYIVIAVVIIAVIAIYRR